MKNYSFFKKAVGIVLFFCVFTFTSNALAPSSVPDPTIQPVPNPPTIPPTLAPAPTDSHPPRVGDSSIDYVEDLTDVLLDLMPDEG